MKIIIKSIIFLAAAIVMGACAKDGETIYVSNPDGGVTLGGGKDVVLDIDAPTELAATFYWSDITVSVSNPTVGVTDDFVTNNLQFSADEDFSTVREVLMNDGARTVQYTHLEFNGIVTRAGLTPGVSQPLYVRLKSSFGDNVEPYYSNVISFNVTPYSVDMSQCLMRGTDGATVYAVLYSEQQDGNYEGFLSLADNDGNGDGWANFYFVEGDGTVWGNAGTDNNPFPLTTDATMWNCWTVGYVGCQYVFMSTGDAIWTDVAMPQLTATIGGVEVPMTFSTEADAWFAEFTTTTDNAEVTLSGTGLLYDTTVGSQSSNAGEYPFSIVADAEGKISFVSEAGVKSQLTIGTAGEHTLKVDVVNYTCTIDDEGEIPDTPEPTYPEDPTYTVPTSSFMYMFEAIDDTTLAGTYTYRLYSENNDAVYTGFANVSQWWNFKFVDSEDPTGAHIYGCAPTSNGLNRLYAGSNMYKIWTTVSGNIFITADFNDDVRHWDFVEVSSIAVTGDFNAWGLEASPMTYSAATGTWSATIDAAEWGESGIRFIVNGDWEWGYSDTDGDGKLERTNNAFIPSSAAGKLKVTLDLNDPSAMTYTMVEAGDTPEVTYDEYLYAYYAYKSHYLNGLASTLHSPAKDGIYEGFVYVASWNDGEGDFLLQTADNVIYGSSPSGGQYVLTPDDGMNNCWFNELGLHYVTVSMPDLAWSAKVVDTISFVYDGNSWNTASNVMSYDAASRTWQTTCELSAGQYCKVMMNNDWNWGYADTDLDGTATAVGSNDSMLLPETFESGTYIVSFDANDASAYKLTFTKTE